MKRARRQFGPKGYISEPVLKAVHSAAPLLLLLLSRSLNPAGRHSIRVTLAPYLRLINILIRECLRPFQLLVFLNLNTLYI